MSADFPGLAGFGAGSVLAGYRLEAQVGAGGMAVVFRARDQRLDRLVALKILAPALTADSAFRRRFIAESRAAAAVDDPHVIPVHEAGEADGVLFIAMRFVTGGDLRGVLEREGALPPGRAAEFISPVASALDAAHRAGLVHRDVKPANILVDASPDRPDHVYLSDFGVSKGAAASVSLTGHFLGTPGYSAPEQIQGRAVDGRADQYALACVAYQLLTGEVPFDRDQPMAVLLAHLSEPPPSLGARRPDLPWPADRVLAKAMAKVPDDRYGSCGDFADALRGALGLASYHPCSPASGPDHPPTEIVLPPPGSSQPSAAGADHPPTEIVSPSPRFPGPDAAGEGKTPIPADLAAAATLTATASVVPPVTNPAVSPATRAHDDHPRVAAGGPGRGGGGKGPREPWSRRAGRAIRPRPVTAATGHLRWTYTTRNYVVSTPAVADGTVYIGSGDRCVYALDAATGEVRWTGYTGGAVDSSPAVAGGTVYFGSWDGLVYALDAATGQARWIYYTGWGGERAAACSSPAVADGVVYVGTWDGRVLALPAAVEIPDAFRRPCWTYTTGAAVCSRPAVADGVVYVGSADQQVYALDAVTGRPRWTCPTGAAVYSSPAVAGGTVYLGSGDHCVYALDAATGQVRWTWATGGAVDSSPAVADGVVYVGSADHQVYALDAATGRPRWTYTTGAAVYSSPAVAGGTVYLGSWDRKVHALDAGTGQPRWSYATGGAVGFPVRSGPAVVGGTVYIGSWDRTVYALKAGS